MQKGFRDRFLKSIPWVVIAGFAVLVLVFWQDLLIYWDAHKFQKISAHEHYRLGGNIEPYLNAMRFANVEKAIFVPTDWPPSNPRYKENLKGLLELRKKYPDKVVVFATTYNQAPEAAESVEEAIKNGAQGIKFIDWLYSERYKDQHGPVDSKNMYRVYEVARKYKVPVLFHIDFQKRPDWKAQFERVAADFPDVTFVLAHYCRAASGEIPMLQLCADTLDKFPNVFIDISMGGGIKRYMRYFDEDPAQWRIFIVKYQDRVMWGTDIILDEAPEKTTSWIFRRMAQDFLMLQRRTYLSPYYTDDKRAHNGLALPVDVLEKIYYGNPKRILGI